MAKTNLYPKDFYLSPYFVIQRLYRLYEKYGIVKVFTDNKFKVEREAWITAVFLLGLMTFTDKEYWVGINPDDSTPDTYGVTFREFERGLARDILNLEIFEWESHSKLTLVDAILSKLRNKAYPDYFILLCYGHSRPGEYVEVDKVYDALQKEKIKVGQIWLLANIDGDPGKHAITELYPNKTQSFFSYFDEMERRKNQKEMISVSKGLGKGFTDLGTKYLPLP